MNLFLILTIMMMIVMATTANMDDVFEDEVYDILGEVTEVNGDEEYIQWEDFDRIMNDDQDGFDHESGDYEISDFTEGYWDFASKTYNLVKETFRGGGFDGDFEGGFDGDFEGGFDGDFD